MMKHIFITASIFTMILFTTGCTQPDGGTTATNVVFQGAVQTGGTSGTADSTGLTLTFDIDPTTLTVDNITVTGATKGALSGSGTTRSLAISNITVADGATVSVTITSPAKYSITGSPQTAVVYRLLTIGMDYLGGILAYLLQSGDPGYVAGQFHGLIASKVDLGINKKWASYWDKTSATGTALGTGRTNTAIIVAFWGEGDYAAKICDDYINPDTGTGVYSDWYLPSIDELVKIFPVGGFSEIFYYSSSEYQGLKVLIMYGTSGNTDESIKYLDCGNVRAVRDF